MEYQDNFSHVAKLVKVRVFLVIAIAHGQPIHKLDIDNVYLHEHIEEDLYMNPPEGYTKVAKGQVCKLIKSICGLKQVERQWNRELIEKLTLYGL